MPKQTFYNLAEEKQQKLLTAAQQEFSASPLAEASIANIVKAAGVPRGSFYQYFEDKEDLYLYLLDGMMKDRKKALEDILERCDGDLFEALPEFYKTTLKEEKGLSEFRKNIFLNMTDKVESTFAKILINEEMADTVEKIETMIDVNRLNVSDDQELIHLLKIIFAVMMRNQVERFSKNLTDEQSLANYSAELELLKKGLAR